VILVNQKLYSLTNYLGVLLRSTNLRNAFEAYYAFEEMARKLIGEPDKLIISSEWDASPFYIPNPPAVLDSYVFIRMPAFASRNALLFASRLTASSDARTELVPACHWTHGLQRGASDGSPGYGRSWQE
jgi:hypothetical protein